MHPRSPSFVEVPGIVLWDHQHGSGEPALEHAVQVGACGQIGGTIEIGGVGEGGDQPTASRAAVPILDGQRHVPHVEVQRVAIEQEHGRGNPEKQREGQGIARGLAHLFQGNGQDLPHGTPLWTRLPAFSVGFCSRRVREASSVSIV